MPAVFTVDLRLNTPRFANVQNILKAKKKPVEEILLESLGLDIAPRIKVERVACLPATPAVSISILKPQSKPDIGLRAKANVGARSKNLEK